MQRSKDNNLNKEEPSSITYSKYTIKVYNSTLIKTVYHWVKIRMPTYFSNIHS